jgi:hypothetical protein
MDALLELTIDLMLEAFDGGDWPLAKQHYEEHIRTLEIEEHCEIWTYFDSKQRAYLKGDDRGYLKDEKYTD